jgi:hypothetical protein
MKWKGNCNKHASDLDKQKNINHNDSRLPKTLSKKTTYTNQLTNTCIGDGTEALSIGSLIHSDSVCSGLS